MMINVNVKRSLLALCLIGVQACNSSPEDAQKYIESGEKYFADNNFAKARLEYKNALQLDNKRSDAYYHLALMDEKDKNWKGMFGNLSQVVRLDPKHVDARLKLAQVFLLSGELDKTNEQLDEIFKLTEDNPQALVLKGAVLLKQADLDAAMKLAEQVLAANPSDVEAISLKAAIFQSQQNYVGALQTLNQALQTNPDELLFNLLKLQIDTKRGDNQAVESDYADLIERFPDKQEFSYALASHYASNKQFEQALSVLQSLIEKHPDDLKPKLALVDLLALIDPQTAEETIKQFIAEQPDASDLHFRLTNLYIKQQKIDLAKQTINNLIESNPEQKSLSAAKILLAKLALQDKKVEKATGLINEVLEADSHHFDALVLKARIDLANGLYDQAIVELRDISRDFSDSDEVLVLLAQAYLKKNAPELAEENFRKALELNPGNTAAAIPVAARMIKSQDFNRAEEVLKKALDSQPNHAKALQMLAQVRLLKKDWAGTQEVADIIDSQPNGNAFSAYLSGKISQGQGQYQEAIEKYKQALTLSPQLSDAMRSLLICYRALDQLPEMMNYVDDFMKKHPDNSYPVLIKSELYLLDKNNDKALSELRAAVEKWPKVSAFYDAIAKIQRIMNQTDKVIETYQQGLKNIPDAVRLRMYLASVYESEQDYQKALEHYETLIKQQPDNDIAVNNLVSILIDRFPNDANKARALELAQRFENAKNPFFLDTYGWALLKNGSADKALPVLEKVISIESNYATFQYHLGEAYAQLNMDARAISVLQKALDISETSNFAEKELAQKLLNELKEKQSS